MNKRQKKISKVMGEFKDGSLKSGGSGRKVTNPKQAIAIALSEAEGMNQGGMMYNQIMQRPMFQTPQQRQGMGIMAGVAPVRGYAEGDLVSDDFFSLEQTEEGSGMNLRDITNFFFDPSDPVDYATLGLIAFPPALVAARLAKMGVKGAKAAEQVQKVVKLQEALPSKIGGGTSRARSGLQVQMAALPAAFMEEDVAMADEMPQDMGGIAALAEQPEIQERRPITRGERKMRRMREAEQMAIGGIASLPGYSRGEVVIKGATALFNRLFRKASKGEDVRADALDAEQAGKLTPKQTDDIIDQTEAQMSLPGIPGAAAKKADDVIDAPVPPTAPSLGTRIAKSVGVPTALVGGVYGASTLMGDDDETEPPAGGTGDAKPELTDEEKAQLGAMQGPAPMGIPGPDAPVFYDEKTGEFKEKATGFKKFLFGEDGIGGEESGFAGNLLTRLQDPRTQYALAKAAQPTEGFVPRNFFSDFTLAGRDYDIQQAELDRLEQQAKPEIVQQFEAIREYAQAGEGETEADVDRKVFKSLFDDMNANAQLEALLTLYKTMPDAEEAGVTLKQFADQLGLGNVSRLLTKVEDLS